MCANWLLCLILVFSLIDEGCLTVYISQTTVSFSVNMPIIEKTKMFTYGRFPFGFPTNNHEALFYSLQLIFISHRVSYVLFRCSFPSFKSMIITCLWTRIIYESGTNLLDFRLAARLVFSLVLSSLSIEARVLDVITECAFLSVCAMIQLAISFW